MSRDRTGPPTGDDARGARREETTDAFQREVDEIVGDLDRLIDTLGHPVCSEILEHLHLRSPQTPAELASDIKASRSTIYRSVRRLVDVRLIARAAEGRGYVPRDREQATPAQARRRARRQDR